jgi:hypothetical protein
VTEVEVVLADCIDLWMDGQDPMPVLSRHPRVADEVWELLQIAQAVRRSVAPGDVRGVVVPFKPAARLYF